MILTTSTRNDLGRRGFALRGISYDDGNSRNLDGLGLVLANPVYDGGGNIIGESFAPATIDPIDPLTGNLWVDESPLQQTQMPIPTPPVPTPTQPSAFPSLSSLSAWFTEKTIFAGVPNWAIVAGGVGAVMMFSGGDSAPVRRRRR